MDISYLALFKSLHIVGFVAWFGGLFYLARILVYHREAMDRPSDESRVLLPQYELMSSRVYRIICNPAMIFTWICGLSMLHLYGLQWLAANPWMHIKLFLLVLLSGYLGYCGKLMKRMNAGEKPMTSFQLRLFNEVPTVLLLAIVLLAVFRNTLHFGIAFGAIMLFGVILYLFAKWYKSLRKQ